MTCAWPGCYTLGCICCSRSPHTTTWRLSRTCPSTITLTTRVTTTARPRASSLTFSPRASARRGSSWKAWASRRSRASSALPSGGLRTYVFYRMTSLTRPPDAPTCRSSWSFPTPRSTSPPLPTLTLSLAKPSSRTPTLPLSFTLHSSSRLLPRLLRLPSRPVASRMDPLRASRT